MCGSLASAALQEGDIASGKSQKKPRKKKTTQKKVKPKNYATAMAQESNVVSGKRRKKAPKRESREQKVKPNKKIVPPPRSQQASPPIPNKVEEVVLDAQSHHEDQVAEKIVFHAQSSDHEDHVADEIVVDSGSDSVVHEHEEGSLEPAAPATYFRVGAAVPNVSVATADALQCGVCFLALRPPIFECEVGHVVCSACHDKTVAGNCHFCSVATCRRSHAMERLVDCIRVACPYAAHGCDATPPYYGQESYRQMCPHAPCHCPGESCGFIGSIAALLDHLDAAHDWPCTSNNVRTGETFSIGLHFGFNFILLADDQEHDDGEQAGATCSVPCRLFLLNLMKERLGHAISVLCIHPHANATGTAPATGDDRLVPMSTRCELAFTRYDGSMSSEFNVVCTDLSSGLPSSDGCFQFVVPNAILGDDEKDYIEVKVRILIN